LTAEKNLDKERGTDHLILDLNSDVHLSFFLKGAKTVGESPTAFLLMMVVWVFTIYTEVDPKGVQKGK
jgi:hypothetical protein